MDYVELKRFDDWVQANEFYALLNQKCIGVTMEEASDTDHVMAQVARKYVVKIRKDEYSNAQQVLLKHAEEELAGIEKNYHLFSFSDEELIEIVLKPDEWSTLDYVLAQKILKARGKMISPELAETIRNQRLKDLAKPEESRMPWIVFGYVVAFLGGVLGIVMGWYLFSHKRILPNGDAVYAHNEQDRKHGYGIFFLGLIMLVIWVIIRVGYDR
jgi:hypothetical protein